MPFNWSSSASQKIPKELLATCLGDSLLARLLVNRGVDNANEAKYYLNPAQVEESNSYEIPEMNRAFSRIKEAMVKQEKIVVYGDYDVDGTTSVALLYRAFNLIGVEIDYYIPSRHTEGYGLNKNALQKFKDEGAALVITCDCGISNFDEVEFACSIDLDVIITDHHAIPETPPPSIANCNPKTLPEDHPLHFLPGVGVAYKLAQLLIFDHFDSIEAKVHCDSLLDLVALGIIADLAPLRAENRVLAEKGIAFLANTDKVGLQELLEISGSDNPNTEKIGFGIAPRINAAGRLADAMRAVQLMITEDREEARELVNELNIENKRRQEICSEIQDEALEMIAEGEDVAKDNCIALAKEGWHHGVVGIVASRLLDKFHVPVFTMAIEEGITKGSVRCINLPNLDIYEEMKAIQGKCGLFMKFGGHKMAAGFSCYKDKTKELIQAIKDHFSFRLMGENLLKNVAIDSALKLEEINEAFYNRIEKLAPYGIEHRQPVFASGPLTVKHMKALGNEGKHLKLYLEDPNSKKIIEALLWNRAEDFMDEYGSQVKPSVCFAYQIKINDFQGERSMQLDIRDWQKPELVPDEIFARFKQKAKV